MSINVADWLRGLGLEQYAAAFAENDIDGEILSELTADDLIGLGVTSIGQRRKLLAAITALHASQAAAKIAPADGSPLPNPLPALAPTLLFPACGRGFGRGRGRGGWGWQPNAGN